MSETRLIVSVPTVELREDLSDLPDGVEVIEWGLDTPAPRDTIDMVVLPYMSIKETERLAGVDIGLVQSQSIGYEGIEDHLPAGNTFANAAGVHEAATSELALALTLASQRKIDYFVDRSREAVWDRAGSDGLADRRVLLLGFGGVGRAIARRLAPFEVAVTAVASRARTEDGIEVRPLADLADLLPETDILIVSLPGGDATHHVVDDAALSALPDGALVVNVGRGPVVDTDALVDHLQRGRIRAALDVMDPEPLPATHPLWSAPGAIVVPHVGGATKAMRPRIAKLLREQIERLVAGEEPVNIVVRTCADPDRLLSERSETKHLRWKA